MPTTQNYNLELVTTQMSQKEVVLNDAFITLDGVVYSLEQAVAAAVAGNAAARDAILAALATTEADIIAALGNVTVDLTPVAKTTELTAAKDEILLGLEQIVAAEISGIPSAFVQGEVKQFRRSKVPATWEIVSDPVPNAGNSTSSCLYFEALRGSEAKLVAWSAPDGTPYIWAVPSTPTATNNSLLRINMQTYAVDAFQGILPAPSISSAATSVCAVPNPADGKIYLMYSSGQLIRFSPSQTTTVVVEELAATSSLASNAVEWYFSIAANGDIYALYQADGFRRWNFSSNTWTTLLTSPVAKSGRGSYGLYCTGNFVINLHNSSTYYVYTISTNSWSTAQTLAQPAGGNSLTYRHKSIAGDDAYELFMANTAGGSAVKLNVGTDGSLSGEVVTFPLAGPAFTTTIADYACFYGPVVGAETAPRNALYRSLSTGQTRIWYFAPINTADNLVLAEKL